MRVIFPVAIALALLAAPAAAQERQALPDGTILVTITGLDSSEGRVLCAMYRNERGFPTDTDRVYKGAIGTPRDGRATCRFEDVPIGTYGIAVLHDADSNGEMATGLFGIPTEGYGASNDARGTMGPPSWEDARFGFDGTSKRMRIRMEY